MIQGFGYHQLEIDIDLMPVQIQTDPKVIDKKTKLSTLPTLHFTRPTIFFSNIFKDQQDQFFRTTCSNQQTGQFNMVELLLILSGIICGIWTGNDFLIINFQMQCTFPVQLLSVVSVILFILPPLCYCSNTFKFNVFLIVMVAVLWTLLCLTTLTTYILFQEDEKSLQCQLRQMKQVISQTESPDLLIQSIGCIVQAIYKIWLSQRIQKWITQGKTNKIELGMKIINANLPIIYE